MSKKMNPLDIMNKMGEAAHKKAKAFAGKETPDEESAESAEAEAKPMAKKKPSPPKK